MAVKRAKTLNPDLFERTFEQVLTTSKRPLVDAVVFLLSFRAGLRVQEIAGLRWADHIFNAEGAWDMRPRQNARGQMVEVPFLFVGGDIGKKGQDRTIKMHDDLLAALKELYADPARDRSCPFVIPSARSASTALKLRAGALKTRINRMYQMLQLHGCSSHSGRRTFITELSRKAHAVGCSLRDVQIIAGHAHLATTEGYIEVSDNQSQLIDLLQ